MNLTRPLVSLDLETTGTDPATDRIVEVGLVTRRPDGFTTSTSWRVNPGVPIPADATRVHGITDADVARHPTFAEIANDLARYLRDVDLVGYNLRVLDLPMLRAEFDRCGVAWPCDGARIIDAFVIYRERERRDLAAAVRFYCGREHVGAHGAVADAHAALDVALVQVDRYPDLAAMDLDALDAVSGGRRPDWLTSCGRVRLADGVAVWGFGGKFEGKPVASDRGFASWVLRNNFTDEVKRAVRAAIT